ncbi:MAG: IS200/IS605 family transposase [Opitutales bacterium]
MGQSLHVKYSHLIFSTKHREALISAELEPDLHAYLGGILNDLGARLLAIGGMPDHLHLIIRDSKTVADVRMIKELKGGSSNWINSTAETAGKFAWQAGYGWFSVSPKDLDAARAYVAQQKAHHQKASFQDEYRKFLKQYGVEYDERYVWD